MMSSAIVSLCLNQKMSCIVPCNKIMLFDGLKMLKSRAFRPLRLGVGHVIFLPGYTDGKTLSFPDLPHILSDF